MDGTGNDVKQDPLHATNVAKFNEQIERLNSQGLKNIRVEYIEGPGTQTNLIENVSDGALGRTSLARSEEMYRRLSSTANEIFKNDPDARISIYLEGFSRGASQVPLLARMIDERGLTDDRSKVTEFDHDGIKVERYTRFHQAPGQTPMAVGLYDPVPTGVMEMLDRRLPPSVVSAFQINAADERRGLFPVDRIVPAGLSDDGRFLSVDVADVHSDIGGSYLRGGLGVRSFNLMTDYRNALYSEPLHQRLHEPDDPRLNVIHRSTEGNLLFRMAPKADRASPEGEVRRLAADHAHLAAPGQVVHVASQAPEPVDQRLLAGLGPARAVQRSPLAAAPDISAGDALLARVAQADGWAVRAYEPPREIPVAGKAALGLGIAATLAEGVSVADRIGMQLAQDNPLAANSTLRHYVARGTGGWMGGALTGLAVGWETGPGAILFVAGGAVIGSEIGEKVATWCGNRDIVNQRAVNFLTCLGSSDTVDSNSLTRNGTPCVSSLHS